MAHKMVSRGLKLLLVPLAILSLGGCAGLSGVATDMALGALSPDTQGIELTAQVGKENNKGLINTKVEFADDIEIDEVKRDANINSGNVVNNKASGMIGLVLAGMIPPLLLLFYFLPTPMWLQRRQA